MAPKLTGIDHLHVYVANRDAAEAWYGTVMGFSRVEALDGGPLTLEDAERNIHLALFERESHPGSSVIAFGAKGEDFLAWKAHLEGQGLKLRVADHEWSFSLYFTDPDKNMHEITTYEHDYVAKRLD